MLQQSWISSGGSYRDMTLSLALEWPPCKAEHVCLSSNLSVVTNVSPTRPERPGQKDCGMHFTEHMLWCSLKSVLELARPSCLQIWSSFIPYLWKNGSATHRAGNQEPQPSPDSSLLLLPSSINQPVNQPTTHSPGPIQDGRTSWTSSALSQPAVLC